MDLPISALAVFLVFLTLSLLAVSAVAWYAAGHLIYPPHTCPATSPADYSLEFESVSFASYDGLTLRGWYIPARSPKGTLVLCHGYAGDCSRDLAYVPLFRDAGYNTLLFDFRGHGASDGTYTSLVYFERGDLLAALAFLGSRGITRVALIGFSMGGAIALATAPQSPQVVGVISDCAFAELRAIIKVAVAARGFPNWLAAPIGWLTVAFASVRLRANLFAADPVRWIDQIAPRPVLIMHGEADEEAPVAQARQLFAAAREPKDLWIVPNAKHRRIEEVAREEYRRRVVDFLDRIFAVE